MTDMSETNSKSPQSVKLSEITRILQEENFLTPEALPPDITFGQARGIAGRKRTQVMRRLRDLGFVEALPAVGTSTPTPPAVVTVDCYIGWFIEPFVFCKISFSL